MRPKSQQHYTCSPHNQIFCPISTEEGERTEGQGRRDRGAGREKRQEDQLSMATLGLVMPASQYSREIRFIPMD